MGEPTGIISTILWVVGGLALFLYGIEMMGNALRRAAGPLLRSLFDRVTASRFRGLLTGTVVTGLIQSSSASTVMIVGFINAGLFSFERSISLILGANVGATITPMITAFGLEEASLPLIGIGFVLYLVSPRRVWQQAGLACMGFGTLFFGLLIMKFAVSVYRNEIQEGLSLFVNAGFRGHLLTFLIAAVGTAIIQTSAATVVMVQAMAFEGAVTRLDIAIPMILGAQVGTCITAIIAAARGSLSGKRAALAHLIFNLVSVTIASLMIPLYVRWTPMVADTLPVQIGVVHVLVRVIGVLLFLPLTRVLARTVMFVARGTDKLNATPAHLDFARIHEPEVALASVRAEVRELFDTSMDVFNASIEAFLSGDEKAGRMVRKREILIDDLALTISEYLVKVAKQPVPPHAVQMLPLWLHVLGDVERIGDHAENIVELLRVQANAGVSFSDQAVAELRDVQAVLNRLGDLVRTIMEDGDEPALTNLLRLKAEINETVNHVLDNHAKRLSEGVCHPVGGMVFVELVTNMRRIANHLRNVGASVASRTPEPTMQIHTLKENMRSEELPPS